MVSVDEIFHRIAKDLRGYSNDDPMAAAEEFLLGCVFDLHVAITADLDETNKRFKDLYGKGYIYNFPLMDYEHGKTLAAQMYWILLGTNPNMDAYKGDQFSEKDSLHLFVHLRDVIPAPVAPPNN